MTVPQTVIRHEDTVPDLAVQSKVSVALLILAGVAALLTLAAVIILILGFFLFTAIWIGLFILVRREARRYLVGRLRGGPPQISHDIK